MSYILTSGYGFSKTLCQDVTTWFLSEYLPRHKITLEILHRGLKREGVFGYCDVSGKTYRPREFLIELQTNMCQEMYIKTLLHELVHLRQWVRGSLQLRDGKMCYCQEPVENYEYEYQPHEIEAREEEERLYMFYLQDKQIVSDEQVAQAFPNRLCSPVS